MKKFENLQAVYYDGGNGTYDLEFNLDGKLEFIQVKASDHPEAATNEDYFGSEEIVKKIIAEAK